MPDSASPLPSLDALLRTPAGEALIARFGRTATAGGAARRTGGAAGPPARFRTPAATSWMRPPMHWRGASPPRQRPVFNLTGTVLHTNLGRAPLPPEAAAAAAEALRVRTNLEFDLATGGAASATSTSRGLLRELTGAEAATVVNNNAAAVLLVLNTLADWARGAGLARRTDRDRRRLPHPRHHGPRRRAAARGRHHQPHAPARLPGRDRPETALLMQRAPGNYAIAGFTAAVPPAELAAIAHAAGLPMVEDLGSGSLVDLARWGLPHEPTPQESLAAGADLVSFSRRQAAGRPAGRADRRPRRIDRADQRQSAEARAAAGQGAAGRARAGAAAVPRSGPAGRAAADAAAADARRRPRSRRRPSAWRRRCARAVAGPGGGGGSRAAARSAPARCRSICCRRTP